KNGFVSLVAQLAGERSGAVWFPTPQTDTPERADFVAAGKQGHLLTDSTTDYPAIVLDRRTLDQSPFAIVGVASRNDVREPVTRLISTSVLFGSLALLLGVVGALVFSQRLSTPIRELTAKARQFAAGERRLATHEASARGEGSPTS